MKENIKERAVKEAEYIIANGATVRDAARVFDVSKSTVHKDVTDRLKEADSALCAEVKKILEFNLSERHLRGGNATKAKYGKAAKFQTTSTSLSQNT